MLKIIHCKIVSDLNYLFEGFDTGKLNLCAYGAPVSGDIIINWVSENCGRCVQPIPPESVAGTQSHSFIYRSAAVAFVLKKNRVVVIEAKMLTVFQKKIQILL